MTIDDKLLLLKAGYTKEEIEGMTAPEAPDEQPAPEAPDEQPAPEAPAEQGTDTEVPAWAVALQASIEKLTKSTQSRNTQFDDMGDAIDTATRADKALAKYITGK